MEGQIKIRKKGIDIKDLLIYQDVVISGDGLYKVEHNEADVDENWKKEEYRYAGVNPNNYVRFNEEIWRIIGLVNVKTKDGNYEQRLKIVRTDGVGNQKNFGSYYWDSDTNNWTTSKLKTMLNGIYYSSQSGDCYIDSRTASTCDFASGTLPKGLDDTARGMVDGDVTWNLGGTATYISATNGLVTHWYNYERGTTVYSNNPKEWTTANDTAEHKGVGLIYPSDYGYASHGGSKGREECFKKELYNWDTEEECSSNDWLKPSDSDLWTITPDSVNSNGAFYVDSTGYVNYDYGVNNSFVVWPVVYLKSNVKIINGTGSASDPFQLKLGEN